MPVTFDGLVALCGAASMGKVLSTEGSAVYFVRDAYRKLSDRDLSYDDDIKKWRSTNIIIRAAGLIPNVKQIHVMDHRDINFHGASVFPKDWRSDKPIPLPYDWQFLLHLHENGADFRLLESGGQARRYISNHLSQVKLNVSLSIRSADFNQSRDANIQDWVALYHHLEAIGYHCIIVPDQSVAISGAVLPFPPDRVVSSAAIDLELRLALYESCYGNLTWTGGHSSVLWLSRSNFLNFGSLNSTNFISNEKYWRSHGISTEKNIPFFLKNQIYDWRDAPDVTRNYLIDTSCSYLESLNV